MDRGSANGARECKLEAYAKSRARSMQLFQDMQITGGCEPLQVRGPAYELPVPGHRRFKCARCASTVTPQRADGRSSMGHSLHNREGSWCEIATKPCPALRLQRAETGKVKAKLVEAPAASVPIDRKNSFLIRQRPNYIVRQNQKAKLRVRPWGAGAHPTRSA